MRISDRTKQFVMGVAYLLMPSRARDLPHLTVAVAREMLVRRRTVPSETGIRARPPGFAGIAWDVSSSTVMEAARLGFYPHAHIGPMKWWSPPVRGVMMLDDVHLAKRFRRTLRKTDMRVTIDQAFAEVLKKCAAPRPGRPPLTWLTPSAQALYNRLHAEGHAHSVEVWSAEGELVGGVFGVDVAPVFSALSMFHSKDDASKLAIVSLYHHLASWGFTAVDHQFLSGWVRDLGGTECSRDDFCSLLRSTRRAGTSTWTAEFTPTETAEWSPKASSLSAEGKLEPA